MQTQKRVQYKYSAVDDHASSAQPGQKNVDKEPAALKQAPRREEGEKSTQIIATRLGALHDTEKQGRAEARLISHARDVCSKNPTNYVHVQLYPEPNSAPGVILTSLPEGGFPGSDSKTRSNPISDSMARIAAASRDFIAFLASCRQETGSNEQEHDEKIERKAAACTYLPPLLTVVRAVPAQDRYSYTTS